MDTSLVRICNKLRLCDVVTGDIGKNKSNQKCVGKAVNPCYVFLEQQEHSKYVILNRESQSITKNLNLISFFSHLRQINKNQL